MNRYVSIPLDLVQGGKLPEEAVNIAKIFSLELRFSEDAKSIEIIAEPSIKDISYKKTYSVGKIWSLDIHDEFVDISKDCFLIMDGFIFYPRIREQHIAKFRVRPNLSSVSRFFVYIDGKEYLNGEIFEQ